MIDYEYQLMKKLEGCELEAYRCPAGFVTVGVGFNMDDKGAMKVWSKLGINKSFARVYNKEESIDDIDSLKLFHKVWSWCEKAVRARCRELNVAYDSLPAYHQFILKDIAYNTGSVRNWRKVFIRKNPEVIIKEARRKPHELMDSRVCKIAHYFDICNEVSDCKDIGLTEAKYIS